jgi:Domain of unknown function (DUF5666)
MMSNHGRYYAGSVWRALSIAAASLLFGSCGGDSGGVGVGGTGTGANQVSNGVTPASTTVTPSTADVAVTVTGPITGFGSVIVSGIKFDDSAAAVIRDAMSSTNQSLRLGMTVEIIGTKSAGGSTASASQIRVFSEIKGPTQIVIGGSSSLIVLGTGVRVDANTVIDGVASLSDIKAGDVIETFGLRDPSTGDILATRIEVQPAPPGVVTVLAVALSGQVQSLNATAKTFQVNGQAVSYASATLGTTLADGLVVSVNGTLASNASVVAATAVSMVSGISSAEGQIVEFEGIVASYLSLSKFMIGSRTVDASASTLSATQTARLKNGARCSVEGKVIQSVVKATELECEGAIASATTYEVSGTVTGFTSASSFTARNQVIDASAATVSGGRLTDLAIGKRVHVKGPVINNVLKATSLAYE